MANMIYSKFSFGDNYANMAAHDNLSENMKDFGTTSFTNDDSDAFLNYTNTDNYTIKTDPENNINGLCNMIDDVKYKNEINYSEYYGEEEEEVEEVEEEEVEEEGVEEEGVEEEEDEKEEVEEEEEEDHEYTSDEEDEEDDENDLDYNYSDTDEEDDKKYEYFNFTVKRNTRENTKKNVEAMNARKEKACLKHVIRAKTETVNRNKTYKNEWSRRLRSRVIY